MAVRLNADSELVKTVREGLKRTGGYCPCRLQHTEENRCICQEFRQQIADPDLPLYALLQNKRLKGGIFHVCSHHYQRKL